MANHTLEERVEILERDLAKFKQQLTVSGASKDWRGTFATFANDPEFEEIVREGQAFRGSQDKGFLPR